MLRRLGKEPVFVDGLRYTDEETMEVVQMVLAGKVNKDLVGLIQRAGGKALGLSGLDGGLLSAERRSGREGPRARRRDPEGERELPRGRAGRRLRAGRRHDSGRDRRRP